MPYTYAYPRPMVAADVLVVRPREGAQEGECEGGREVLLIRRANEPFRGSWALPGGFVEMDEDVPDAASRELREETGLEIRPEELVEVGVFGRPGRDPRGRTISVVYAARVSAGGGCVRAGDDAAEAEWFDAGALPELAFDHADVIPAALRRLDAAPHP
jgi:8-oxo-dGTP diphosphatase